MRILKLRFKNINSLKGEWQIDFADPAYADNGLFAIVGPTGAGKSTILDAICLSLYGRTPRLDTISKSSSEIINRASADCYAQTTFSCEKGKFRATFEQHFSNRNGTLQPPSFDLADAETGEPLTRLKSQFLDKVEELIGLNYEQFTRAVMLAQGQFKKFLESNANDRSELLETITGTQIYSKISQSIFERYGIEKAELDSLENQRDAIVTLTDEQQKEKEEEVAKLKAQSEEFRNEMDLISQQLEWVRNVNEARKELDIIERSAAQNEKDLKQFEPQRSQLVRNQKAQKIVLDYRVTLDNKKALDSLDQEIANNKEKIEELKKKKERNDKAAIDAQTQLTSAQAELEKQNPVIEEVKRLDAVIAVKNSEIQAEQIAHVTIQRRLRDACQKACVSPAILPDNITADAIDSQISKLLHGVSITKTNQIINGFFQLKNAWERLLDIKKKISEHEASIEKLENDIKQYIPKIEELNAGKKRLESEKIEAEKKQEILEENVRLAAIVQSLEEHRKNLVEGKECPLCGSKDHPYCHGVEQTQPKNKRELEQAKKQTRKLQEELDNVNRELERTEAHKDHAEQSILDLRQEMRSLQEQSNTICSDEIHCDEDVTIGEIEFRIQRIEIKTSAMQQALNNAVQQDALKAPVQIRDELNSQNRKLEQKKAALKQQTDKRQKLFGTDDPQQKQEQLSHAVNQAKDLLYKYKKDAANAEGELTTTEQALASQMGKRDSKAKAYNESVTAFNQKLEEEQFSSVDDYLSSILTEAQQAELQNRQNELDEQKTRLEGMFTQIKDKLSRLEEKPLTDKSEEELNQRNSALKAQRDDFLSRIGAANQQLAENEKRKIQHSLIQTKCEQKKPVVARWAILNNLIGSADGKKYRRIVQRISLELLIDYANEQMNYLASRYKLTLQPTAAQADADQNANQSNNASVGTAKEDLAIYCIDSWQGDSVRPTTNLSGGESFLVSLALALGLSKMSSQNCSLETLFLDEGFGSLDEITLQTALDAINKFQHSDDTNKLVGIISHVDALKERIANKIEVARSAAGASVLSGPGVTRIS